MSSKFNNRMDLQLENQIIDLLRQRTQGLTASQISKHLGFKRHAENNIWRTLRKLQLSGTVERHKGMKFTLAHENKSFTGVFIRKASGSGEVAIEDGSRIHLPRRQTRYLVDGDLVAVGMTHKSHRHLRIGFLRKILKRRQSGLIGYCLQVHDEYFLNPLDCKSTLPLKIQGMPTGFLNQLIEIQVIEDPDSPGRPAGKLLRVLGLRTDYGIDSTILINKHGLRDVYPEDISNAIETITPVIPEQVVESRLDLRGSLSVTIDPANARDFDDAISIESIAEGYRLGIHIADVSHYVVYGSPIDREAYLRGTSVYLPERAIHMLPDYLATHVCSLKPGEDRLTMSVFVDIDREGAIIAGEIKPSIIRSGYRLTYQDFFQLIEDERNSSLPDAIKKICLDLSDASRCLLVNRKSRGVLDLDIPEASFIFNDRNEIIDIVKKPRTLAEQTVEEFMIAANIVVAEFLNDLEEPCLFRTHKYPDISEVNELKQNLSQLGLQPPQNPLNPEQANELLNSIESDAVRSVASYYILRAMKRAVYSVHDSGHFGLALEHYTQFTSPIRRYPDLEVHRAIKSALKMPGYLPRSAVELEERSKWLSERERIAQEAEWDAEKLQKIRFMQNKIGQIYRGTITHVEEFGVFVQLDQPFVEGLIPVKRMKSIVTFDEDDHSLRSAGIPAILKAGIQIDVKVVLADIDRSMLDFELV